MLRCILNFYKFLMYFFWGRFNHFNGLLLIRVIYISRQISWLLCIVRGQQVLFGSWFYVINRAEGRPVITNIAISAKSCRLLSRKWFFLFKVDNICLLL